MHKQRAIAALTALVAGAMFVAPAIAHHSFAMYDQTQDRDMDWHRHAVCRSGQSC